MSAKQPEQQASQPQYAPQPDPNAQYGPVPQEPQAPYQGQPVNQQYFAQPQAAPVQYVVMAESLKGSKGWLQFFQICFGLASLSYISIFFAAMSELTAANVVSLLFAPVLAALSLAAVIMISMEKAAGKWVAVALFGVAAVYGVINTVVTFAVEGSERIPQLLSGIIIGLVIQGLMMTYFFTSRRVKETLIK